MSVGCPGTCEVGRHHSELLHNGKHCFDHTGCKRVDYRQTGENCIGLDLCKVLLFGI